MHVTWVAVAFLATTVAVLLMTTYSGICLVFAATFAAVFLLFVGIYTFQSAVQSEATPGIESIQEPDFWFSPIYFPWLYVNDRARWAKYVVVISYLLAVIFGSVIWFAIFAAEANPYLLLASWLVAIPWVTVVAVGVKGRISSG